ncbi:MAG: hypothetical protein ACRDRK_11790 [Pseudonocardia sp.]
MIGGTDVRVVLAGHTHVVSAGTVAGIPVWTGGALATMRAKVAELRAALPGPADDGAPDRST